MSWRHTVTRGAKIAACGFALSSSGIVWSYKEEIKGHYQHKLAGVRRGVFKYSSSNISSDNDSSFFNGIGKVFASWTTNHEPQYPWDDNWDRRDPRTLVKPPKPDVEDTRDESEIQEAIKEFTPKATRHVFLIRHGQYHMDSKNPRYKCLTELGLEQAEFAGARLKELDFPYTHFYHSTMERAKETACIIHKHLPQLEMNSCDLLREGAPVPPEPPVGHWKPEASFFEDGARIEAAFRKYFQRASPSQKCDSYEVIVCHANVIRYFVCRALQLPPEAWLRMCLNNCSITHLSIRPSGRVSLRALGDSGFMPPCKITHT